MGEYTRNIIFINSSTPQGTKKKPAQVQYYSTTSKLVNILFYLDSSFLMTILTWHVFFQFTL